MYDAGTYTLVAENRNGSDKVDLDLIVLDPMHDADCAMFKNGNLTCQCSLGFRYGKTCLLLLLLQIKRSTGHTN